MKRKWKSFLALLTAFTFMIGLIANAVVPMQTVRAEQESPQSPVIGAANASGTGAEVTFRFTGTGSEASVAVKGEFYKNWAETIPLNNDGGSEWSLTREIAAGWYEYGLEADGAWQGDPLNPARKNGNPGLAVPGMSFNVPEEAGLGTSTPVSAVYYTGDGGEQHAAQLSVDKEGVEIVGGSLVVDPDAEAGQAAITASYEGFTGTTYVNIVSQPLRSPVVNGDGTVTFNNRSHTGETLYLVGSMNEWNAAGIAMSPSAEGVFSVTLPLRPGTYEYKFLGTSGDWNSAFTDPLNPNPISNGNSAVHVPGIRIESSNEVEKGSSIPLSAKMVDAAGAVTDIEPEWSMLETKPGIFIENGQLTISADYAVAANDYVTLIARQDGFESRKQIAIQDRLYTYNIHYFRYDGDLEGWDNWIFKSGAMNGTEYDFTDIDADGFATVQVKLPLSSISIIQRPGDWSSQDLTRDIAVPDGQWSVHAWIVQGKPEVYYEREAALEAAGNPPAKRYVELKYVRPDADYDQWNLWVWGTGARDGQIDFDRVVNGAAVARIEIGAGTQRVGFKVRYGTDWQTVDVNSDRYIETPSGQTMTKATVTMGQVELFVVPAVNGPKLEDGSIAFYYRDDALYNEGRMDEIEAVKLNLSRDGGETRQYTMTYSPENEYFHFRLANVEEGLYEYTFLVTANGTESEVNDPRNTANGKSVVEYRKPGVAVAGTVSPASVTSRENAVLTVRIEAEAGAEIEQIYADLSSLGGPARFPVDAELRAASIAVKDSVAPGVKTIPVTVVDQYGNRHAGTASVTVKAVAPSSGPDFDWDEARIYFLLTDRFHDGDPTNNYRVDKSHPEAYHGGDFQGLIEKLDYLEDLGINTIWITPIVDNIDFNQGESFGGTQYGYHGYWAQNFETLDEHLGDLETFKRLIDEAHDRGIKIMVDVVLNHTGYGLKPGDTNPEVSQEAKDRFAGMLRTNPGTDDITGELAGLPDFRTEDPEVRARIIEWQTSWLERARTDRGDTIDYFRVDTVKHVEETTWKAFKNALTQIDPNFKLIGEYYGAGIDAQGGALRSGQMDSLLDFDFNNIAEQFVKGGIDEVQSYLERRNAMMDNTATMGQFLSSHDENGFLSHHVGGDFGMMKTAVALQLTAKGQPVIYYGEELGQSGANGGDFSQGQFSENRDDMPWHKLTDEGAAQERALHAHYRKLLHIRGDYSKVFAKGSRSKVAGGDEAGYLVFDRHYRGQHVLVGLNTTTDAQTVTFQTPFGAGRTVKDEYGGLSYKTNAGGQVTVNLPSRNDGGTFVLTLAGGSGPVHPGGGAVIESPVGWTDITAGQLAQSAADGQPRIEVPAAVDGRTEIRLPVDAADYTGGRAIELSSSAWSVTLPSAMLEQLRQLASAGGQNGSERIVLEAAPAAPERSASVLEQATALLGAGLRLPASGNVYEFRLYLLTASGEKKEVEGFAEPVTIALPVPVNADAVLLGIYHLLDVGEAEYVGGVVQNGWIAADVEHFSLYAALEYRKTFSDVPNGHWASRDIQALAARHMVQGVSPDEFRPNGKVTRAEFAAMLSRTLGLQAADEASATLPFRDVAADAWYSPEVAAAYEAGLIRGREADRFDPQGLVTREEMAVMIARAAERAGGLAEADEAALQRFKDADDASPWARAGLSFAAGAGIVQGDPSGRLLPDGEASRAEAAAMLRRLLTVLGKLPQE